MVQALAGLQAAIEHDDPLVLLRGPAGIGKTLLLRLLRRRVEGRMRCVELEVAEGQDLESLCTAALRELGREREGDPAEQLARVAGEFGRAGVLLALDRAERLAPDAVRPLLELASRCPSLQVVLAAELPRDDPSWLRSPDPRIALVELSTPMTPRETIEYLRARLALAVAPAALRRKLGWRSWPALIRASRGNPALLHHHARRRVLGAAAGELPEHLRSATAPGRALRWWALGASAAGVAVLIAAALLLRPYAPGAPRAPEVRPQASRPAAAPEPKAEPAPVPAETSTQRTAARPSADPVGPPAPAGPPAEVIPPAAPLPPVQTAPSPPPQPAPATATAPAARPEPREPSPPAPASPPGPARAEPNAQPAPALEKRPGPPPEVAPPKAKRAPAPQVAAPAAGKAPAPAPQPAPKPSAPEARPVEFSRPAPAPVRTPATAPLGAGDALARPPAQPEPPRAAAGIPVFVNAVPAARIEIDGRDVGSTPIVGLPIAPGTRRFAARFDDGRRVERTIQVEGTEVYVLFP
jgi:type II secretory pathway predicted ATPase ExeA